MIRGQKVEQAAELVVDWALGGDLLRRHILNGACRGLYSMKLAREAIARMDDLEQEIGRMFLDVVKEA